MLPGCAPGGDVVAPRPPGGEDVSYVLLEPPLIPPLDLTDSRCPAELPALLRDPAETLTLQQPCCGGCDLPNREQCRALPPQPGATTPAAGAVGAGRAEAVKDCGSVPNGVMYMHGLPASVKMPPHTKVTEVRTLVVDMRDLDKYGAESSGRTQDSSQRSAGGDPREDSNPYRGARRVGGVLKGGGEYVSNGVQKPRPRVSFLLDAHPQGEEQEDAAMQIRVYAKPQQGQENDPRFPQQQILSDHAHPHAVVNHPMQAVNHQRVDPALPNGLPPKRFRPLGSAERRHAPSYRHHPRQFQVEARPQDPYPGGAAPRSADSSGRMRRLLQDSPHPLACTPHLPHVHPHHHHHRPPSVFSFKRRATNVDAAYTHGTPPGSSSSSGGGRGRRSFTLPPNSSRQAKGQVRFQDATTPGEDHHLDKKKRAEVWVGTKVEMEPGAGLGTYSASDHPPRAASCNSSRPPLPPRGAVHTATVLDLDHGGGPGNVNSASSRSGRVREWLSVSAVPASSLRTKTRPSTVSSASNSSRSRDFGSSANQRLPPPPPSAAPSSSRASSASLKAASDPGPDLDNMDLVTLNLMARRAKGPVRYRYLAKLRSLSLNTPSQLNC